MDILGFFITLVIIEILCLVGIILAFNPLHRWKERIVTARIELLETKSQLAKAVKASEWVGEKTAHSVHHLYHLLPWWLRSAVSLLRWLGKITLQTS